MAIRLFHSTFSVIFLFCLIIM